MARANPQWKHFGDDDVLTIFQGPHAYVSPRWYETGPAVPTWNYTAVHVYGVPQIITDHSRICDLLQTMVETYESSADNPWTGDIPAEFRDSLIESIVAFEIPIRHIEAKFKLSQNRPKADQRGACDQLRSGSAREQALAALMEEVCDLQATSGE
jgi:transcriptional regulator